jgi:hypothetical protein
MDCRPRCNRYPSHKEERPSTPLYELNNPSNNLLRGLNAAALDWVRGSTSRSGGGLSRAIEARLFCLATRGASHECRSLTTKANGPTIGKYAGTCARG